MSVTDLIVRIKNGYMAGRETVEIPYSSLAMAVLEKLKALSYIESIEVASDVKKLITVKLRYDEGVPAIVDVEIFTTSGRRWYVSYKNIRSVLGGMGYAIVSTSKGIMAGNEARKAKIGGELLFHIW